MQRLRLLHAERLAAHAAAEAAVLKQAAQLNVRIWSSDIIQYYYYRLDMYVLLTLQLMRMLRLLFLDVNCS